MRQRYKTRYPDTDSSKFKTVRLFNVGDETMCEATTVDGVTENFNWGRKNQRETVRNNMVKDCAIIVDEGATRGWDYE